MNIQQLLDRLEKIGLTREETTVYLHLLKNGAKTPLELSRNIDINRTRVYRILESLLKKKIIQDTNSIRGKKFKADQPENLQLIVENLEEVQARRNLLPDIISTLKHFPQENLSQFEAVHYRGVDGLKQMLWNELSYNELLCFGYGTINIFAGKPFGDKFRSEAVRKKMTFKEIFNAEVDATKTGRNYTSTEGWYDIFEYRTISSGVLKIRQGTQVYGDTVSIISWAENEYVGIEIKNKNLAAMQRQLFWHFWQLGKKPNHPMLKHK